MPTPINSSFVGDSVTVYQERRRLPSWRSCNYATVRLGGLRSDVLDGTMGPVDGVCREVLYNQNFLEQSVLLESLTEITRRGEQLLKERRDADDN